MVTSETGLVAVGLDVEAVAHFRERPCTDPENEAWYRLIFTPAEIERCGAKSEDKGTARQSERTAQRFTACFAGKEATVKALSSSGIAGVRVPQVEITDRESGNTGDYRVRLVSRRGETPPELPGMTLRLSITATSDVAMATCFLSREIDMTTVDPE
ncbi:MAG: 4'-phosphopantetheinyl transferase superfamily protein [Armatimonadota bacterium]